LKAELLALTAHLAAAQGVGADGSAPPEAKTINDRVAGWLFKLPQFKASLLQPKIDDFLKKPEG